MMHNVNLNYMGNYKTPLAEHDVRPPWDVLGQLSDQSVECMQAVLERKGNTVKCSEDLLLEKERVGVLCFLM